MSKRKITDVDAGLGRNLAYFRKLEKLTQQQVADMLNINRTTYTKYETGASEPGIEMLKNLAEILHVDVGLLISASIDQDAVDDVLEGYASSEERFHALRKRYEQLSESGKCQVDSLIDELLGEE